MNHHVHTQTVYFFSDQAIESVDVVKDLGVLVDSKLNFFNTFLTLLRKLINVPV